MIFRTYLWTEVQALQVSVHTGGEQRWLLPFQKDTQSAEVCQSAVTEEKGCH